MPKHPGRAVGHDHTRDEETGREAGRIRDVGRSAIRAIGSEDIRDIQYRDGADAGQKEPSVHQSAFAVEQVQASVSSVVENLYRGTLRNGRFADRAGEIGRREADGAVFVRDVAERHSERKYTIFNKYLLVNMNVSINKIRRAT